MTCIPEGRQDYADDLTVSIDAGKRCRSSSNAATVRLVWRRSWRRY